MKKMGGNKGFTLVELIIVIAILAIIMLIAIPNFSGIQQRMKVRADKATAAQIGKAVRVWYTDYTSDPILKKDLKIKENETSSGANTAEVDNVFFTAVNCVDYTKLTRISSYTSTSYKPSSLLSSGTAVDPQYYVVGLTSAKASDGKICVGIVGESATQGVPVTIAVGSTVNYDGGATADAYIAYVEP